MTVSANTDPDPHQRADRYASQNGRGSGNMSGVGWWKRTMWLAIAVGLLATFLLGFLVGASRSTADHPTRVHGVTRSLNDPSYLYEGKPAPAWEPLDGPCGPIRDAQGRPVLFATGVQLFPPVVASGKGPAPTASLASMSCAQMKTWVAEQLASGRARAFATNSPEYQAFCTEDSVIHHTCH